MNTQKELIVEATQRLGAALQSAQGDGDTLAQYMIEHGLVRNPSLFEAVNGPEPWETDWSTPGVQERILYAFEAKHPDLFAQTAEPKQFIDDLFRGAADRAWLKYGDW